MSLTEHLHQPNDKDYSSTGLNERVETKQERIDKLIAASITEIPVLTPDVLQAVSDLDLLGSDEDNDGFITNDVMTAIGVFSGIKPTGIIDSEFWNMYENHEISTRFFNAIKLMGIKKASFRTSYESSLIAISRSDELNQAVSEQWTGEDFDADSTQYTIGKLLGYPKTSTQYYLERLKIEKETGTLPDFTHHGGKRQYAQLVLSPDNYQDELTKYSIPLEESMRVIVPRTYDRIEKSHRKSKSKTATSRAITWLRFAK